MKRKKTGRRYAGMLAWILFMLAFLPYLPLGERVYGAVSFGDGEISYSEELVALWNQLAAQEGVDLERTDFIGHMTRTYPQPGIVVYKQQTSVSPSGTWSDYEYRNMYCISHSKELADNPNTTMETTAIWYIRKDPYTLENMPEFIKNRTADEEMRRLNFLIMAYAANYESYQGTVNSDPVIGTAEYYLCQSFCTLSEEAKFTGDRQHDWGMYRQHATQIANRYHPSELGSSQVYEDMMEKMETVFDAVWNTARLAAACTESSEEGYLFHPVIVQEADGMYHARYPLTPETRELFMMAVIVPYGDWSYELTETAVDFRSSCGQLPEGGAIARIDLEPVNGIIRKSIGKESVRELHMPVRLGGRWSLTFAQGNLISNLQEGLKIVVGDPMSGENPPAGPPAASTVVRYRHREQWQADYVVNLRKLDAETGKPLEGAWFDVLEAFDDSQLSDSLLEDDNWDNDDGSQFLRWKGWDSSWGSGEGDPCPKDQEVTGSDGWLREAQSPGAGELLPSAVRAHRDIKYYSYTKGYCGGHPEPEDEEDEEAWEEYEHQIEICESLEAAGGFYHALTGGARELLRRDRDRHYEEFVSLTYDYSVRELTARKGYILHNQEPIHEPFENKFDGIHRDTVPVETVTVHSSQYYALAGKKGEGEERERTEVLLAEEAEEDVRSRRGEKRQGTPDSHVKMMIFDKEPEKIDIQKATTSNIRFEDSWKVRKNVPATASNAEAGETMGIDEIWIVDEDEMWEEGEMATPSNLPEYTRALPGFVRKREGGDSALRQNFKADAVQRKKHSVRTSVSFQNSLIAVIPAADRDYSGQRGTDWSFELYDHRTEGEVHINKRDLLLKKGENEAYDSYGDTQGDGTLEGAVYGLFAAVDLIHPDGVTGVVFEKGNLVSVAATDKNGDASFMAITEAPGSVYDYGQGSITATGFTGPENVYHQNRHQYTSNPDLHEGERWHFPITDNQSVNGNCWIGRPLLLGSYYVQELTRSEGYELSVYGVEAEISNRSSWQAGGSSEAQGTVRVEKIRGVTRLMEDTGYEERVTEIDLMSEGTKNGFDISVKNLDEEARPVFYQTTKGKKEVYREWREAETYYETMAAVPGTLVRINGQHVEAEIGDQIVLPGGETVMAESVKTVAMTPEKVFLTGERGAITTLDTQYIPELTGIDGSDTQRFLDECNLALAAIGLEEPGSEAPYFRIALGADRGVWADRIYEFLAAETCPAFNAARLETVVQENGDFYGILRYTFLEKGTALSVVYSASNQSFYVKHPVGYTDGTAGYLYQEILLADLAEEEVGRGNNRYRWIQVLHVKPGEQEIRLYEDLGEISYGSAQQFRSFWAYQEGDLLRDADGSIYQKECLRYVERSGYQTVETVSYEPLSATYDSNTGIWQIHVTPEQLLQEGGLQLTIRYGNRMAGGGQGLSVTAVPSMNLTGTYVQPVSLIYPGQWQIYEDAGTREIPVEVLERAIRQRVQVMKDIERDSYRDVNSYGRVHEDWFTRLMGGYQEEGEADACAKRLDNFRFKIYLKSNLARLYRAEDGSVVWQNRQGEELDMTALCREKQAFPELVRKIYTKVTHGTAPLFQDSQEAVIANEMLYGYTDNKIHEEPGSGYTAILETMTRPAEDGDTTRLVKVYNYEKFFDAVDVANHDKWDDAAPTYTSWQPIGNEPNRREEILMNARVSDEVRQFAIDWYLEDELTKLVVPTGKGTEEQQAADGELSYSDEALDQALYAAIQKAENYLKPFFAYDLDEIYAIDWDDEIAGGSDRDRTTLSADTLWEEDKREKRMSDGYLGTSAYLPYGTYVVVEQQPRYAGSEYDRNHQDFKNKHYQIDRPREISLPSVYEDTAGAQTSPEIKNRYYCYDSTMTQQEQERRYRIRFGQEDHVIRAHSHHGDFEIYKYGMDVGQVTNGVPPLPGSGDYFALTQEEYKPYQNYYNHMDNPRAAEVDYYLTEGLSGRRGIAPHYRYSSLSEHGGRRDDVPYVMETTAEHGMTEITYRDQVTVMHGMQTAFDGLYAPALVPWSVVSPAGAGSGYAESGEKEESGESCYRGFGYVKFRNRFFAAKLRLEKLDSETHENILHDEAIFAIYAAKRDAARDGTGQVCFYEEDTVISGGREFLESMGAWDIRPMARKEPFWKRLWRKTRGPGERYTGVVPAGTPICEETERILLRDEKGNRTGSFASYSTVLDGKMRSEESDHGTSWQLQTTGYLETPQPLGAGAYVICEEKAPAGYVRSAPIALEVYSDKITYYKEGRRDSRVLAAVYERPDERPSYRTDGAEGMKLARVNVENEPVRLKVEKQKEASADTANTTEDKTVTYKISGRVDGKLADIGNHPDYVYAYKNGHYLGYGWRKGTLEYLTARKRAGEQVRIAYEGEVFAGYGYVTRKLGTADDENPYVAGAIMALFDALLLKPSGDSQDHTYEGLVIERSPTNHVTRMYVKQNYAGERTEFLKDPETGQWTATVCQRPDTDILYYDLGSLEVISREYVDGRRVTFGYDRNHNKIPVTTLASDQANFDRTDTEHSLFAFQGGWPYLELVGGDFNKISYSSVNKVLTVGEETKVYHLDREGNRDALVDPYTGMAYVTAPEEADGQVMVWPVQIHRDEYGNVIARDKITTSRVATVGENLDGYQEQEILEVTNHSGQEIPGECRPSYRHQESGSITGTWRSEESGESHQETTLNTNQQGQNLNGEVLTDDNNGSFVGKSNPILDRWGLPEYYQRSGEGYDKGTELYDRNGDFVRYQDSDNLEKYNNNAYHIQAPEQLYDGRKEEEYQNQKKLYHRQGEGYILENIWVTSDKTPNDPFDTRETEGQADILKRVPVGNYIMEELKSPEGYLPGLPVGISVQESSATQEAAMVDKTIKVEISKIDAPFQRQQQVWEIKNDGSQENLGSMTERTGGYTYGLVPGAELALFTAKRVYSAEAEKGYYLEKTGTEPLVYESTNSRTGQREWLTARWVTGTEPIYVEGLPAGDYLLVETAVPEGFTAGPPAEITVDVTAEAQVFFVGNDHTKVEIEKYVRQDRERELLAGAKFALYEAVTDEKGEVVFHDGSPRYDAGRMVDQWTSSDRESYRGFISAWEAMYRDYGTEANTSVRWKEGEKEHMAYYVSAEIMDASSEGGHQALHPQAAVLTYEMENGERVRIAAYGEDSFEYQFHYRKMPEINGYACAYTSLDGVRRLDYLPAGKALVLVETEAPNGYARAEDRVIRVGNTGDVQRYGIENREGKLYISKVAGENDQELSGARLRLYRAGEDGEYLPEEARLVEEWVSGTDGIYTDEDFVNGRIPEGYHTGDKKPHEIQKLTDGSYWLTEEKSPDYYTALAPVRIDYRQEEKIRIVRVRNVPVSGSLEFEKTDRTGRILKGAVFELTAYRQQDMRNPVLKRGLSDIGGVFRAEQLPVGEMGEDGKIIPYLYKLREVVPPEGYAVNTGIFTWEFAPNRDGASYRPGESADKVLKIVDEPTRVSIGKKDFDHLGVWEEAMFLKGAELAVYELTGRDEMDGLLYEEERPVARWITDGREYELEGLIAGHSYLLKELSAPEGYELMDPVIFTLSADGRRISEISDRIHTVTVHTGIREREETRADTEVPKEEEILAVTLKGRYPIQMEYELWKDSEEMIASWKGTRDGQVLDQTELPEAGGVCMVRERIRYHDGSSMITEQRTEVLDFDEEGLCHIPGREAVSTEVRLSYGDGREIDSFRPGEAMQEKTIFNHASSENPEIFQAGESYLLTEYTEYSDGSRQESGKLQFTLNRQGAVTGIVAADPKTRVRLSKIEITGGQELPGCHMRVKDACGRELVSWISGEEPYLLEGILQPGESYYLEELNPREGYAYAEEIRFTVFPGGIVNTVTMADPPTNVIISKTDVTGESELPGNRLRVKTKDGQELVSWISREEPYQITGILKAGETYILEETGPKDGYAWAEEIEFTVSEDGGTDRVVMKNDRTHVEILKVDADSGEPLSGARLQICDSRGRVLEQWLSDGESHEIIGKLKAGEKYYLREKQPPEGYQISEEAEFWVPRMAESVEVIFENQKKPEKARKPGRPESYHPPRQPEMPKEPGRIRAIYSPRIPGGDGRFAEILPDKIPGLAAAGDRARYRGYLAGMLLSLGGMIFTFSAIRMTKHGRFAIINRIVRKNRKKQRKKK